MNRLITISLVLIAAVCASCHRSYYDDTVRTPRGGRDYHDSYSSRGYQKKKVRLDDSYSSDRHSTKHQQEYSDSYSTKSKKSSASKYKDTYSSGNGRKRKLKFYDSFSSKKRKNIFLSK